MIVCCPSCQCPEFDIARGEYIVCAYCSYDERPPEKPIRFVGPTPSPPSPVIEPEIPDMELYDDECHERMEDFDEYDVS